MNLDATGPRGRSGADDHARHLNGVHRARVRDIDDPTGLGRVRLTLPATGRDGTPPWARIAAPAAGAGRGAWFAPEIGDEVLVAFEEGDPDRPYVIGALWNADAAPPRAREIRGDTREVTVRTASGVEITITETEEGPHLALATPWGNRLTLDDREGGSITVTDSERNVLRLDAQGIEVRASGRVSVDASRVEMAAAVIDLQSPMVRAGGVVQADTLVVNHVVASSYTPGAGNVW